MFLLRNKKNIDTFWLKKVPYQELWNSVEEANWSGYALFVIQYVNMYQQSGSNNKIGWQLKIGVAS